MKNAPKPVQLPSSGDLRGVLRPSTNDAGCRLSLAAGGRQLCSVEFRWGFLHESGARSNSACKPTTPPRPTTSDQSTRKEGAVEGTEVAEISACRLNGKKRMLCWVVKWIGREE